MPTSFFINRNKCYQFGYKCQNPAYRVGNIKPCRGVELWNLKECINPYNTHYANTYNCNNHGCKRNAHSSD